MSRIISGKLRLDVQPSTCRDVIEAAIETVRPRPRPRASASRKLLDPLAGPGLRRPEPAAAGGLEPAVQRHQVHARRAARCRCCCERVNSHVEISVADTGIGIEPRVPAARLRPLPPGRRVDHARARRPRARALDRQAPRRAARRHRAAPTSAGRGPRRDVHRAPAAGRRPPRRPRARASADPTRSGRRCRDEQVDPRRRQACSSSTTSPTRASSSRHVLGDCQADGRRPPAAPPRRCALVRAMRPDVLVSDIGMPERDGYEFMRDVRQLRADERRAHARHRPDRLRPLRRPHAGDARRLSGPRRQAVEPHELMAAVASLTGRMEHDQP